MKKYLLLTTLLFAFTTLPNASAQTTLQKSTPLSSSTTTQATLSTIVQPAMVYMTTADLEFIKSATATAEGRSFFIAATKMAAEMLRQDPAGFYNFVSTGSTGGGGEACKIMRCSLWWVPCAYDKVSCSGLTSACNCSCGGTCSK